MKKKENDEIRITPDALISLVVTEAEERELASMPSLKEMNAQFHPSEQFQKKMDRLLKKAHRKEGWVQIWKPTKKGVDSFYQRYDCTDICPPSCSSISRCRSGYLDPMARWFYEHRLFPRNRSTTFRYCFEN